MGAIWPQAGIAVKPLADGFIALIKLSITPLIFLVVATGVAQVGDMRKVGRIGLKTLIYFEIITTIALIMGTLVGNAVHFGAAVQRPSGTQLAATAQYASAHTQTLSAFLFAMVPDNLFGAFVHESVLQVLVIALLVGAALLRLGETGVAIRQGMERCISLVFGVVNIIVMTAPIGAFGALGFTVGRFGIRTLYALGMFVGTAWLTLAVLMFVVFGVVCRLCGVRILDIMGRLKEELLVVIATSSSEVAIPGMMQKLEASGISRTTLGLVLLVQPGWRGNNHTHELPVHRPGLWHPPRSSPADHDVCPDAVYLEGSGWCHGRRFRGACRHGYRQRPARRRTGPAAWH
jgi:aerobic C4-dicarboxylate transport protein